MKKIRKPQQVVLLSGQLGASAQGGGSDSVAALIPPLHFDKGAAAEQNYIEVADNALCQIFEIDGLSLALLDINSKSFTAKFAGLLNGLDCNLQLLIVSRPTPIGTFEEYQKFFPPVSDAYLKWYLDYSFKWFSKVCDHQYIPNRRFYAVISSSAKNVQNKTPEQLRRAFKASAKACLARLDEIQQHPRPVAGEEARLLLSQYFLTPALESPTHTMSKLAACLSDSTIMEPEVIEKDEYLKIGDNYHGSCAITQLPAAISVGWLYWPIIETAPYTVSIHFESTDQKPAIKLIKDRYKSEKISEDLGKIVSGDARAVRTSVYISTYGKTEGELKERLQNATKIFLGLGAAVGGASGRQRAAWRSSLPLGYNERGLRHLISSEAASTFWPCVADIPSQINGIYLGFGTVSHSPVCIDPNDRADYLVVAANLEDTQSLNALLSLKYLTAGMRLIYIGASEYPQFLGTVIGPETYTGIDISSKSVETVKEKALTHLYWDAKCALTAANEKRIVDNIRNWAEKESEHSAIFIEADCFDLADAKSLANLKRVLSIAKARDIRVFLAIQPKQLGHLSALKHSFQNKIIFRPTTPAQTAQIKKHLDKNYSDHSDTAAKSMHNQDCTLIREDGLWYVSLTWSPMDVALLSRSYMRGVDNAKIKASRKKMFKEVVNKNPKMPECDAWRQTIYYLGLQQT